MKKLVLAVVLALGMCVFAALPVSADSGTREAEIAYRSIKIVLDGREICPRDAAGNEVEPFIMDGTTYLPVRAVADALGLDVRWRGSDSTVMLSSPMTGSAFRGVLALPPEPALPAPESAHGHNAVEIVTLGYRDIRLLADGVAVELRDSAGNAIEPFILDGTTYLPVRAAAELFGMAVSWDRAASTVSLSTRLLSRCMSLTAGDQEAGTLVMKYEYDRYGRMTSSYENLGITRAETKQDYDEAGRLVSSETLVYSTFLWPERLSGKRITAYSYDKASGLCVSAETTAEGDDASCTGRTEYEYDALGRLTAVRESLTRTSGERVYGEERSYIRSYDGLGRLAVESLTVKAKDGSTSPSIGASALGTFTFRYTYDEDGKCTSALLDGIDGQLRLYDFGGDLTAVSGSCIFSYDDAGRFSRTVQSEGGDTERTARVTEYSYDERGLRSWLRIVEYGPVTQEAVFTFFFDEDGVQIRQEQTGFGLDDVSVTSFEYILAGRAGE